MGVEETGDVVVVDILPGILEKDFAEIQKKAAQVKGLVDWLHVDVLDNTLIKNITYNEWDTFKPVAAEFHLEAHLMVLHPQKYLAPLTACGFKRLVAHVEADHIREFLIEGRKFGIELGVAIDGP
ncbi:hypothetical protein C4579_00070, partial [Candidatus Microgenomates bacterium]